MLWQDGAVDRAPHRGGHGWSRYASRLGAVAAVAGEQGGGVVSDPRQQWSTPRKLFDALHAEFGFTVDACANEHNHRLPRYWSPEQDGLRQSWGNHVVWANPPYDNIEPWIAKAYHESRRGAVVVMLLPVRTDREWWHRYALKGRIELFVGRVNFEPPPGIHESSNREPSALVIFDSAAGWPVLSRDAESGRLVGLRPHGEQLALGGAR